MIFFSPRERKKVLDYCVYSGTVGMVVDETAVAGRGVLRVYIRRVRCVRGGLRACKTVLYAGHNDSDVSGQRKGGAAGIMVGGGRLYTHTARRRWLGTVARGWKSVENGGRGRANDGGRAGKRSLWKTVAAAAATAKATSAAAVVVCIRYVIVRQYIAYYIVTKRGKK